MADNNGVVFTLIMKAIIPGNKDIKVNGVKALCASLNVLHVLAIDIHNPLMKKEYTTMIMKAIIMVIGVNIMFKPS